jgi:hypothetical protein
VHPVRRRREFLAGDLDQRHLGYRVRWIRHWRRDGGLRVADAKT